MESPSEQELNLRAQRSSRRGEIHAIKRLKGGGMSRKRLVDIYGRDLVDEVLGTR